jgi:DNA polymerase-1
LNIKVTFGCSAGKLAKTLGVPEAQSKMLYANFWDGNPALKALKEAVEKYWSTKGNKKYLPGLDGRMLCTRSQHSLLNVLFQSALAIIMDYALAIMDKKLGILYLDDKGRPYYLYKGYIVRRVAYVHDEAAYESEDPIAEEVSQMLATSITEASKYLKLRVLLKGEGKVGKNWKETH